MSRQIRLLTLCVFVVASSSGAWAGLLDNAWLKGVTDKAPLSYGLGEEIVFTLTPVGIEGDIPEGKYRLKWTRSDDYGNFASGTVPFENEPFVYKTQLDKPGFVRLEAVVIGQDGTTVVKKFTGDATTPEGRQAMNRFEKAPKQIFFDGGAGVCVDFFTPENNLTSGRGLLEGRVFEVPFTNKKGSKASVDLPIMREDMLDGRIELSVNVMTGNAIGIERIRVLPASGTNKDSSLSP